MEHSTEELLISAVLNDADLSTPQQYGIDSIHFLVHSDEWTWLTNYARQHKVLPSKALFRSTWPQFTIAKSHDTEYLSGKLLDDYARHLTYVAIDEAAGDLLDEAHVDSIVSDLTSRLRDLSSLTARRGAMSLPRDSHAAVDALTATKKRLRQNGQAGIRLGFPTLDDLTGGAMPGEVWIVGARLGQYKSTTLMRMGLEAARQGHHVAFFALEMTRIQVTHRLHSMLSGMLYKEGKSQLLLDPSKLRTGRGLRVSDYRTWMELADEELSGGFDIVDVSSGRVSPNTMRGYLEAGEYDITFVDYITLLQGQQRLVGDDWQNIAAMSAELKGIAGEYEMPVISAAQLNRTDGVSKKGGFSYMPPGPESIARADAIGQDADLLLTQGKATKHAVRTKIAKARHVEDGDTYWVHADLRHGTFEEVGQNAIEKVITADEDALYGQQVKERAQVRKSKSPKNQRRVARKRSK